MKWQGIKGISIVNDTRTVWVLQVYIRGAWCHAIYCQNCSWLWILPMNVSRSQSLKYLYIKWGLHTTNICVLLEEKNKDNSYMKIPRGLGNEVGVSSDICNWISIWRFRKSIFFGIFQHSIYMEIVNIMDNLSDLFHGITGGDVNLARHESSLKAHIKC